MSTDEGLWDSRQVRIFLGCSLRMVQKLVQIQELPARRIGRLLRFEPDEVRAYRQRLPVVGQPVDRRRTMRVVRT